jgi:hypothetical protein
MFLYGKFLLLIVALTCALSAHAQTIWYPQHSSDLLKSTAHDVAVNFNKAIPGVNFTVQEYNGAAPAQGVVFRYDSTITSNGSCRIQSDGTSYIRFTARQDNGLNVGIYAYLQELGFRFYLPGTLWEKIPSLTSAFRLKDTVVKVGYKYNTWFISGGYSRWAMDNDQGYNWDVYTGKNGHEWAKYQRRNIMTGEYRFNGHRGDIYSGSYLQKLNQDKCLIAAHNGERIAGIQSVPDINSTVAKDLWAKEIESKYVNHRSVVFNNNIVHKNLYRNFDFANGLIGVEVADGARWGNSASPNNCNAGNWNGQPYPSETDQQFLLVNHTAEKINNAVPQKSFQCYAYDAHASVPSANINLKNNLDVQVVATAFQLESSAKGLLNRWYGRHANISEYHYLNIPQWGGETPVTSFNDLKQTIKRIKSKQGQGLVVESSPAKFTALPILFALNDELLRNASADSSLSAFAKDMFTQNSSQHVLRLFQLWGNEQVYTLGDYFKDNKFKLPLYFGMVKQIEIAAASDGATTVVQQRIIELKSYLHYMRLYYEFVSDNRSYADKVAKAEELCFYLARIAKLQVVNSYYLIQDVLFKYPQDHQIWRKFNTQTGSVYLNGGVQEITSAEIEQLFSGGYELYSPLVQSYKINSAHEIINRLNTSNIQPLEKIKVKIGYTNGKDYSNRTEMYVYAARKGKFNISCIPEFTLSGKGFVNITVESSEDPLLIVKDVTITPQSSLEKIEVMLPESGFYKLTILSKYKTNTNIVVETGGNVFYRNGPFYGNMVENYRQDLTSLPRFFYVPENCNRIYFSVNNACETVSNCISAADAQSAFSIKDQHGDRPTIRRSSKDASLFYFDVTDATGGFFQVNTMREYRLCFTNIANVQVYGIEKNCPTLPISASLVRQGDECLTMLRSSQNASDLKWEIYDAGRWTFRSGVNEIVVPLLSSNAIINVKGKFCSATKRLGDLSNYSINLVNCSSGAAVSEGQVQVYPNPSSGIFNFKSNGAVSSFDEIIVSDSRGVRIKTFANVSAIDLTFCPAGIYFFVARVGKATYRGKLLKI